jgi:Putative adhesin
MYEFDRSEPVTVVLRAHGGSVDVTAEERDTVVVEVHPAGGTTAEVAQRTTVTLDDDVLVIQAPGGDHWAWRRNPKLQITVRVPAGSSLSGKSVAAGVRLAGGFAVVQLTAGSADVQLEEAAGDVSLETSSGHLTVGRVGGSLRLKTGSGNLHADDVSGDVNALTASGRIRLGDIGGSARVRTASGGIVIDRLHRGQADVRTASGDIQVGIAPGAAVWMDLDTSSGKSVTDLTAHGDVRPPDGPVRLELQVRTASGNIRIHRAGADHKAAA